MTLIDCCKQREAKRDLKQHQIYISIDFFGKPQLSSINFSFELFKDDAQFFSNFRRWSFALKLGADCARSHHTSTYDADSWVLKCHIHHIWVQIKYRISHLLHTVLVLALTLFNFTNPTHLLHVTYHKHSEQFI